ncbi:asparagine synthetase B family protein [Pseudanabaena sp. PCC 6802]|uniref:asparagine synthetase B family protein n=1 Tax=Pseudanabaena sp. PCC 6802 TaxID=118173 RepID=UPI000349FEC4|nr:asparagine synthase-related protein [Pseudanabaena sp. PCC 6802]
MSGILGVWNSQKPTPWQNMLDDLHVLGQDGQGDWHDTKVCLSLGCNQFFDTPESCHEAPVVEFLGCVLVWDGRLDARELLLADLPSSTTDAQLLIASYRRWGIDCLKYLIGEFAFILWDAFGDLLLVGCDPVGGRTLAYYWDGKTLLLSSRVVTLLLHPQVSKALDELYLAHTICNLWAHPPGITPFAAIARLRPGFALVLQSGQLQQRQIARLAISASYNSRRSPEIYYEELWHILDRATKDRLRSCRSICSTLSGGLDSTTVTISLLNHLPVVDAFSTVTDIFPEFDERQPIQSFLQQYPQVRWHPVNSDRAWSLSEPWHSLPVTDDPLVSYTLAMNISLMEQIQRQGFGLVFDGEGGDELFYTSLSDLARAGCCRKVLHILKTEGRWHSAVWREFVLPRLPRFLRAPWFARRQRLSNPLPVWIAPAYAQTMQTRLAIQQYYESTLSSDQWRMIMWGIDSAGAVGMGQVYKLMSAAHQLQYTSPLLDRRLVEFAIALPPALQYDSMHEKIFLRQANQTKLPQDILWRSKENYFDPLKYAGLGKGHQALELLGQIRDIPLLRQIVNVEQLKIYLDRYRQGYSEAYCPGEPYQNNTANQLYYLLAFVNWYQKVSDRYVRQCITSM